MQVSLASLVLQLKQLGVADVLAFPFMDPPPKAALLRALELLLALGALDPQGALSRPLGAQLVRLPLEPVFGKVRRDPPPPPPGSKTTGLHRLMLLGECRRVSLCGVCVGAHRCCCPAEPCRAVRRLCLWCP